VIWQKELALLQAERVTCRQPWAAQSADPLVRSEVRLQPQAEFQQESGVHYDPSPDLLQSELERNLSGVWVGRVLGVVSTGLPTWAVPYEPKENIEKNFVQKIVQKKPEIEKTLDEEDNVNSKPTLP
jgi:hypothetical protein